MKHKFNIGDKVLYHGAEREILSYRKNDNHIEYELSGCSKETHDSCRCGSGPNGGFRVFEDSLALIEEPTKKYRIHSNGKYIEVIDQHKNDLILGFRRIFSSATQFADQDVANAVCLLLNRHWWAAKENYVVEEIQEPKTCDGKIVKMKDDDGVEREYKLTLVEK